LLGISLQSRSIELARGHALTSFAFVATIGPVVAAAAQLIAGPVSDRRRARGSRRIEFYAGGAIVAAAAILWFYLAPNFAQLVCAVVVLQAALNVAIGPYQAVIPDFIDARDAGTASAWMAGLFGAGNAVGAVLASFVRVPIVTALCIAALLLASVAVTASHVARLDRRDVATTRLRISRAFFDLLVSRALLFLGFYTLLDFLLFFVTSVLRVPAADVKMTTGILLLVFTVAGVAGAAIGGRPADRFDRRAVATAGAAGFIVALGVFLTSHALATLVVAAALAGIAWAIVLTADWALGCAILPRSTLATAMAVWNLALIVPQIVAPSLTTALLRVTHLVQSPLRFHYAFFLAALEIAAGMAWLWRLPALRV
jgi:MFS family permease